MSTQRNMGLIAAVAAGGLTLFAGSAVALEAGDWVVRGGPAYVDPTGDSDEVPGVPGGRAEADGDWSFGFSVGYMVTDNWSVDLLAATPFRHDIDGVGSLAGNKLGTTKHLPPTLSLLYYFDPDAKVRPYAGLGVNYTTFFDTHSAGPIEGADMELDDSIGPAVNVGMDIELQDGWFANAAVWYIDLETEAHVEGIESFDVQINPLVFMFGVGKSF